MKLHIGGKEVKEGWKLLNIQAFPGVDYVGDISDLSQFPDRSIDEIYASHVLEHVRAADIEPTLAGIYRVLKRGGRFMVAVPDMDALCRILLDPTFSVEAKIAFSGMIFGGQTDAFDYHYAAWNFEILQYRFGEAGFMQVDRVESFGLFEDTSEVRALDGRRLSLNVVVTK